MKRVAWVTCVALFLLVCSLPLTHAAPLVPVPSIRQETIDELHMYFHRLPYCINVPGYGPPSSGCTGENNTNLIMNHTEQWNPAGTQSATIPSLAGYLKFISEPFNGSITLGNFTLCLDALATGTVTVNATIVTSDGYVYAWTIQDITVTSGWACYPIDAPAVTLSEMDRVMISLNASSDIPIYFDSSGSPSGITFEAPSYMADEGIATYNKDNYKQTVFGLDWPPELRIVRIIGNISNQVGLDDIASVKIEVVAPNGSVYTNEAPTLYEQLDIYDGTEDPSSPEFKPDLFRYLWDFSYCPADTVGTWTVRIIATNTHGDQVVSTNTFDIAESAPYVPEFPHYSIALISVVAVVVVIAVFEYKRRTCRERGQS